MYCIRGLKSSLSKITYPSGEISELGSIAIDPNFAYVKNSNGGYSNSLFGGGLESNPTKWVVTPTSFTGKHPVTNIDNARQITIQPRQSDNGNMLPHNTSNRYISALSYSWTGYENQRFSLYRNSVPLSLVNEYLIFQANIKKNASIYSSNDLVRVDPGVIGPDATVGSLIDVPLQYDPKHIPNASIAANGYETNSYLMTPGGSVLAYTLSGGNYYSNGYTNYYNGVNNPNDVTYRTIEVNFSSSDISNNVERIGYIHIGLGGIYGDVRIYFTGEFRDRIIAAASLKNYVTLRFNVGQTRGYLDDTSAMPTLTYKDSLLTCFQHGSDFLPEQTEVDPAGEFVILKFNRMSKVDVLFNDLEHGFDLITDENNEIRINKRTLKFTTGGLLQITQKHRLNNSGKNKVYAFVIPDTVAPDQPAFTSAARDIIYGTGTHNDIVYVEREGILLGSSVITSTGSFEITLTDTVLANGETITLYTKDTAGNKSSTIDVLLDSIISENRINTTLNSDVLQQIGYHN